MNLQVGADAPAAAHVAAAALLVLHIGGGAVGIVSGFAAMAAPKGGPAHRLAGHTFFVAMLCMTIVGAGVAPFLDEGRWSNTTAAVFTFYLVITAWSAGRMHDGRPGRLEHAAWVIPVGIAVMGLGLAFRHAGRPEAAGFATVFAFAAVSVLAAISDLRMLRRGRLAPPARMGRHVWRMSAALFVATGSFFLGQQKFLPEPVRGTLVPALPVLLGVGLGLYWFVRARFPTVFRSARSAA